MIILAPTRTELRQPADERQIALLRMQVTEQLAALKAWLEAHRHRAQYGERCSVVIGGTHLVVNGDRFY